MGEEEKWRLEGGAWGLAVGRGRKGGGVERKLFKERRVRGEGGVKRDI